MAKEELIKNQEQLARFAKALGHPIRIAILRLLARKTCYHHSDMSEMLPVAKSTLSQHLKELREAELIYQETISLPTIKYCINKENWALAKQLFAGLFVELQNQSCSEMNK